MRSASVCRIRRSADARCETRRDGAGAKCRPPWGAAEGVRKEIESVVRAQAERVLRDLDVVQREEFEAVKAMAQKAREENELLKERIAALEAKGKGKKAK